MNDIVCGKPLGPRVVSVVPTDDYKLILSFNNNEKKMFDATQLLDIKVFYPLKDIDFFKTVRVEYGTVVWAGDIDYCPDTLYAQSRKID